VTSAPRTVLVVEDEHDLRQLVELILGDAGYAVRSAGNGREALDEVAHELPGLILLDMKMPVMNGWEFVAAFRGHYDRRVPIVVVTAAQAAQQDRSPWPFDSRT
jgi:CheY-like chemotaxis protein